MPDPERGKPDTISHRVKGAEGLSMRALIGVMLVSFLTGIAAAQHRGAHDATIEHSFEDVEQWVQRFESPEREKWQHTQWLLRSLELRRGAVVADLGAGTGYFTRRLSLMVGPEGKVYAVDIEPAMLEHIRVRKDIVLDNVATVLAKPDDPMLPQGQIELILCVNTWHHIDNRIKYLKRVKAALKPGGRFVLVDFHEGEMPVGPPAGHKLKREDAIAEFEKAGWKRVSESTLLPYQYMIVFQPPGS